MRKSDGGWPKTKLVKLDEAHRDHRGMIQSLVNLPVNNVSLITSREGTVRSNHYHVKDWHYIYVLSGSFDYYFRPTNSNEPLQCIEIKAKHLVFTPPMEDHATIFKEDCELLAISKLPRDQDSYENDVRRISLIDPKTHKILV